MRIQDRRLDITNSACGYIINETYLTCQIVIMVTCCRECRMELGQSMRIQDRILDITKNACGYTITHLTCQINSNTGDMLLGI